MLDLLIGWLVNWSTDKRIRRPTDWLSMYLSTYSFRVSVYLTSDITYMTSSRGWLNTKWVTGSFAPAIVRLETEGGLEEAEERGE